MKQIKYILLFALLCSSTLCAKEHTGIIIGAGVGMGHMQMSIHHAHIAKYPLVDLNPQGQKQQWEAYSDNGAQSWALAWEFLLGYKHFINDIFGLRYYANVGIQHYKPIDSTSKKEQIGIIDYSANMDMLLNFYTGEKLSFGIFGGVGFGGSSFSNNAINEYESIYDSRRGIPIGASAVKRHFFNVNFNAGVRLTFFQKTQLQGGIRMCDSYAEGRRICTMPTGYIGHSFELNAKFPTLTYQATTPDYVISTAGQQVTDFRSRPGYKIKNPYRFSFRYIIDF